MWEVLTGAVKFGFKAGTLEAVNNFVTMIKYFQSMLNSKNAYDVAVQVGKHTNIIKELFNDKTTEGLARYENIQELLNSIKEWTESPGNDDGELGDKSLGSYLQQITLLTDADEDKGNGDVVKLMTIHAAKGLEFACVFIGGIEETLFPSAMSINTREELEEERRLFYVAVTRAKKHLWLTYANTRYRFGQLVQNEPSRFIAEMPEQYIDRGFAGGGARNQGYNDFGGTSAFDRMSGGGSTGWKSNSAAVAEKYGPPPGRKESKPAYMPATPVAPKVFEHKPTADFAPSDTSDLQVGQKVEHQKFGFGEVLQMEGSAHNPIATVKFEHNGEKKIMLNYAKLRIVE
jgi:DNA helicase-2/ATP-dependent DNA helicase PcrA